MGFAHTIVGYVGEITENHAPPASKSNKQGMERGEYTTYKARYSGGLIKSNGTEFFSILYSASACKYCELLFHDFFTVWDKFSIILIYHFVVSK